ncbi:gliding motility-associated-like protein [Pedobacter africanus]|uniref:Gliding motility-associated-like protein n=1 Tax=Pedobacter africanus TaxID=151894 RepID=A0ACC6L1V7_9SPHI|nr:Calx-beta domain-containing protein [Pedobacter africanus]MDR6785348.1 gliding motility-associated-like protein [Pedobacter africanus]
MKRLLLSSILMLFVTCTFAADYYWVGGAGNWTDLNHWASVSGGVANKSIVPGTGDDVYFDANSGLANNTLVTLPTGGHAYCRNMSWNGVTAAAIFRNTGSFQLQINGNLELAAPVRYAIMALTFTGNSNATFRTNGAARINQAGYYNSFVVNKPGGSLTLLDEIKIDLAVQYLTLTAGTLDLSGNSHSISNFVANGTGVRNLNITNSTITVGATWDTKGSNMTLTATGSAISADMFHSGGLTFAKVIATRNNPDMDIYGNTFEELILSAEAGQIGTQRIGASNTIGRLEFKGGGRIAGAGNVIGTLILAPGKGYIFHGNNTINTSIQANTADCDAMGELRGADANARLTFGAGATADIRNVLITSLTAVGGIIPIAVVGEDGGGNTGFNFTPRTGGNATLYWVGGEGEWNDKAHWSATSGGPGGACVPFTTDNVIFDANSGFTSVSKTVMATSTIRCHNMTWTNVTNSPVLDIGGYTMEIWGSIVLGPTVTLASANTQYLRGIYLLKGTEASTFTANGASLGNPLFNIEKTGVNGGLTILDDLTFPACSLRLASGKLLMPGRSINIAEIRSQTTNVRSTDFSNATITVNDWANDSRNCTFVNNAAGSFITAKVYFVVNGLTYPKVHCNTVLNAINITGTSISELVFTNTSSTSSVFALSGAGGNTIGTLDVRCGGVTFMGNNTITNLLLSPSRTYNFRNRQTINGLFRFNNPDCEGLGEMRGFEGTSATLNFGPASTQDFNNVYVQNMAATGAGVPVSVAGADAGGNTGFVFTSSAGGSRYWVGGSGDWNDSSHWSTSSGGTGGACVPTVSNDVFFDANSFTTGSSAVTIAAGNAYCRNMDWTGAAYAPTFTKPATFTLEIWGNLVLSPALSPNIRVAFMGPANATFTPNNATLGTFSMDIIKPGSGLTFLGDYNNTNAVLVINSGTLNLNGRTIAVSVITDNSSTQGTSLDIRNANITANWQYTGSIKSLQAAGSSIKAGIFRANGGVYNKVDVLAASSTNIGILNTTFTDLLFSNASNTSQAYIGANNTIGRLEYRGRGAINGTGNAIETLIFAPGRVYTFLSGSTTTITKDWFGSGTPCNLTEITSSAAGAFTVAKTAGEVNFDYVRLRNITATGATPFKALEHSENLGGNTNWDIAPYNGSTPIVGLGPDKILCAGEFPYTIKTDGFFASPLATYTWGNGSSNPTLVVAAPGTYTVTVSYPDGCTRTDEIVITRSDVVIAPITGTANVCTGAVTNLSSATAGGVWSSSNTAVATVSTSGAVTGVAAGTADIIYTVTNGNGCTGTLQQTVTVNATPAVATTAGPNSVFAGDNITLTNATIGGVWSSSNTAVATVDASGLVTGVAAGTVNIIYTVTGTGGCTAATTTALTVDAFDPAKRVLSITKTADAAEPATPGALAISLPAGVNAIENITVSYTVTGTATAGSDYTALTGTATIVAGQNSVAVPVDLINDTQIESAETVIATLTAGTSANYTYTIDGAAANVTVQIADDDDVPANRLLSATAQLNANEPANTGTFTIALPNGVQAPEAITVAYAMSGTAANGVDYETLTGTTIIPAGQNSIVINVKALDDQIIEQTKDIILTITGGTTATAGNFGVDGANAAATLIQTDNDYTVATRQLSVASNGNAAEPGTNSSFTISLPTGYVSSLPVTVSYTLTGTAAHGADYNAPATTITLPAGQNSIQVPVNVINDDLIEQTETVILTVTGGVASQGGSTVFTLSPNASASNASLNITDEDNTPGNRTLTVTAQNGAEPVTNGSFTVSLPSGLLASEDISVTYTVGGTATPGSDYVAIAGSIIIPAGQNSVQVPVTIVDNGVIEATETVVLTVAGGTSANFSYTQAAISSATANITDDDAAGNSTLVLLTKVSDAIEGGTNGQYRISLPPGVTSAEDITISFTNTGTAIRNTDYTLPGVTGGNITIPAGANAVNIDVNAANDGLIEGPEAMILNLTSAISASQLYAIDPAGNGAVVNIVDANAASSTPLQVFTNSNAAEPSTNGSFLVKLAGVATSAWPVTVGYRVSGTAVSGIDYQGIGTVTIPANQNSVTVNLNVKDDQIIETAETVVFTLLSGSATDGGGNAFIFPPDLANDDIMVNLADNDDLAANQILKVVKTTDAAEPGANGSFTVSLPAGYTSSANLTLNYNMSGSATRNTDYSIFTITLPAYSNSVSLPVSVINDQIVEGTETAIFNLTGGTDGNSFTYTADPAALTAAMNIADDDNTAVNRTLAVVAVANATEGGAAGSFTIKLPDGITATTPVNVNYTLGGTATSVADYAALTGTATIATGQNSTTVTVTPVNDNVIELTETVTLTITGGTGTGGTYTPATGSETASLNIADNDNVAGNKSLKVVRTAHAAEPGSNGAFSIGFEAASITSSEDITVNYTIAGTATSGTDYTALSGTVVLPAGQSSIPVSVLVKDDQLIEPINETVILTLTGGNSASFTFVPSANAALRSTSLNIVDDENIPANRVVTLTKTADAAEPGTNGNVRFSLPPNILCQVNITVNVFRSGTAAGGTDYLNFPVIVIPAGQNYVDIPVSVVNDNIIEQTETVIVAPSGINTAGLSPGSTFTFGSGAVTVNITDDENTPANRTISLTNARDGEEGLPASTGSFRFDINLPSGISTSEAIAVNYTIGGTALNGTDYTRIPTGAFTGAVTIGAGQNGISLIGNPVDDQIIEGTENVVITITSVTSPNFTYTFGAPAAATIADNDNAPANLELAVNKTADAVEGGANGEFIISLPGTTTIATETITVNYTLTGTATNGTDYTALTGAVVIPAGDHEVKIPVSAALDQIIEGLETVTLTLTGGRSGSFTFTPNAANANATVNITDADNIPANLALSISKLNDASEPSTSGRITFALPAGITATQNITVNYTVSGSATADADYAALPGTATILAGRNSVTIPVSVIDDQLIEPLETVTITLSGGSSPANVYTGAGTVTLNISDDESIPANLVLSISKDTDATEPNTPGGFIIALPENVTSTEDITVSYAISGTATAGVDYDELSGTAVIPTGNNSIAIPVTVADDQLIESNETVIATLTSGSSTSFSFTATGNVTINIADDDISNPANFVVTASATTNAAEPGTNGSFAISLPAGILAPEAITLNYTMSGTATAGVDYSPISGAITIPAGENSVLVPVIVSDDQIMENTETVILTLNGGTSANFAFTGTGSARLNITDDENATLNKVLAISKTADAAEPATNGGFNISLPAGITATENITVNYTVTGTAAAGTDYTPLTGTAVIIAGQNGVSLPLTVTDDQLIEQTETVIVTLNGGSSTSFAFTGNGSATLNITDDENTTLNKVLLISKTADAAEPAANGGFNIGLPAGITAAEQITVNYTVSGTATAGTDYAALTGSAVIPTGQNAVAIPVTVINDNVYETPETLTLTLSGGTSANFTFTASGSSATATASITDDDKMDQVITFTALPVKTFGDPAFTLSATGGASGNPVVFTSSNPAVAMVSGNTVTIIGVGTASITASQAGNAIYHAAANVTQVLTVLVPPNTAPTLAAIANQQACFATATQNVTLSGITAGTETNQTITLSVSSNNPGLFSALSVTQLVGGNAVLNYTLNNSAGGTALITVTVKDNGGTANGGTDTFSRSFTLVASPLPQLLIEASPGTSVSKGQTLDLRASGAAGYTWANAAGIISGQNSATLTVRPAQTTTYTVTGTSAAGCTSTQSITITVIEDYNLVANNVLTPNGDGKNDFFVIQNIDMYPNNEVRIFDRAGRAIYSKKGYNNEWDGTINGTPLHEETYYYIIELGKGVKPKRGFISIVRKY